MAVSEIQIDLLQFWHLTQAHVSTVSVVNEGIKVSRFNMLNMFVCALSVASLFSCAPRGCQGHGFKEAQEDEKIQGLSQIHGH